MFSQTLRDADPPLHTARVSDLCPARPVWWEQLGLTHRAVLTDLVAPRPPFWRPLPRVAERAHLELTPSPQAPSPSTPRGTRHVRRSLNLPPSVSLIGVWSWRLAAYTQWVPCLRCSWRCVIRFQCYRASYTILCTTLVNPIAHDVSVLGSSCIPEVQIPFPSVASAPNTPPCKKRSTTHAYERFFT